MELEKGSANYGLEDMVAGLRWVKANIAKFGSRSRIFPVERHRGLHSG